MATDSDSMTKLSLLPKKNKALTQVAGANRQQGASVMMLSGTSVAAPVVSGTVALMLQANPGLTPPLSKATLQFSARPLPLPGASLLQQGAGMINVEGAIRLARVLRSDIGTAAASGVLVPGASMLATGRSKPLTQSTLAITCFN